MVTVAVDVMGADRSPEELLTGAADALSRDTDVQLIVAGPEKLVKHFADKHERVVPLVAPDIITSAEHPTQAVRQKPQSSIVLAAKAVRHGDAQALFSAGSTGAVLTACTFTIGRIHGIKRPALALAFPGAGDHKTVILDLGANADVRPEVLVQFAHMGRAFSHLVVGVENPTVGLLNNGSESEKGSELARTYHTALAEAEVNFIGNAEGTDLLNDGFDVVVTDGFTGNIALKSVEGAAKFLMGRIKGALDDKMSYKLGAALLKPVIKSAGAELSGDEYGGAFLLGLQAPVIKGHGSTTPWGVTNGILQVAAAVRGKLVADISEAIQTRA